MGYDSDILLRMSPTMREQAQKQIQAQNNARERKAFTAEIEANTKELPKRETKYGNKPTQRILSNGTVITFDSKKEALHFDELSMLLKAGTISDLKLQYVFTLKDAYTDGVTGDRYKAITYKADFVYTKDGKQIIEDVKGGKATQTKVYMMKKKLMRERGYYIEEI